MIQANFRKAATGGQPASARGRLVRLLSIHSIWAAVAALTFAGSLGYASGARAQTQLAQAASCVETCEKEQKDCLNAQSTEELCEYDYKQCEKACGQK